ncbi:MAG TPA: PepSY domain-containing protein [Chloroflexia bacterium]|nr:PepSY domain-containing protein [Chloroflexia bacterium]
MFKTKFLKLIVAGMAALLFSFAFLAGVAMKQNNALAQTPAVSNTVTPAQNSTNQSGSAANLSTTQAPNQADTDQETNDGPDQNGQEATSTEPQERSETADNSPVLQAQAKITVEQAKQAALAAVPGTVASANLEDENGTAAYSVIVNPTNGGTTEDVKVDAATGKVLKTEAGNDQEGTGGSQSGEQEDGGSDNSGTESGEGTNA